MVVVVENRPIRSWRARRGPSAQLGPHFFGTCFAPLPIKKHTQTTFGPGDGMPRRGEGLIAYEEGGQNVGVDYNACRRQTPRALGREASG